MGDPKPLDSAHTQNIIKEEQIECSRDESDVETGEAEPIRVEEIKVDGGLETEIESQEQKAVAETKNQTNKVNINMNMPLSYRDAMKMNSTNNISVGP